MTEIRRKITAIIEDDEIVFYEEEVPRYTTPCCGIKVILEIGDNIVAQRANCYECGNGYLIWRHAGNTWG